MQIQKPKGTKDILPSDIEKWQYVEKKFKEIVENYGYKEIRVPVFEHTELFERGVGETTDVVQKEMYTFEDKGGRSVTLRPEGTAGVIRAFIENGMSSQPSPCKVWYNMPMYRYENVQKGRYREFRQGCAELIGASSYLADVELIAMADSIIKAFDVEDVALSINSIGCPTCRKQYQQALREFIGKNLEDYCPTCKNRFEKNPMRILDCKEKKCKEFNQGAPIIIDYLCDECAEHFKNVKKSLDELNIKYVVDSGIVRGLDYYTKTVFEFISKKNEYTVLAGGRYDGLVKELGGASTPAVGFGMGMDRLVDLLDDETIKKKEMKLFIGNIGDETRLFTLKLVEELRNKGLYVEKDILERSLNAQMKYADKRGAKYTLIIGQDEMEKGMTKIKNMQNGEEKEIALDADKIIDAVR